MKIFATALLATMASAISLHSMEEDSEINQVVEQIADECVKARPDWDSLSEEEIAELKKEGKKMLKKKL